MDQEKNALTIQNQSRKHEGAKTRKKTQKKDERRTSNIEHPTSNEKRISNGEHSTAISVYASSLSSQRNHVKRVCFFASGAYNVFRKRNLLKGQNLKLMYW